MYIRRTGITASPYSTVATVNREQFIAKLTSNGLKDGLVYLKGGVTTYAKWSDSQFPFRQEKNFYYLTGVPNPDYHLIMNLIDGSSKLVMPTFDEFYTVWNGRAPTKDEIASKYDINTITSEEAKIFFQKNDLPVYLFEGEDNNIFDLKDLKNITNNRILLWAVQECRVIKKPWEFNLLRKSGLVSGNAHIELMKSLANNPLTTELKLQALFEYECAKNGSYFQAYCPIVAAGKNASHLHYGENNSDVGTNTNEILLVDAGGEYDGYASDITRSYPVSGKFDKLAKTLYEIVLKMQNDVIDTLAPGVTWKTLQDTATNTAKTELEKINLLIPGDEINENKVIRYLFCHGIGHYIGLDVHDVGGNSDEPPTDEVKETPKVNRLRLPIKANSVLTVEPGLYFSNYAVEHIKSNPELSACVNIELLDACAKAAPGIRIEDYIIVHDDHNENITNFVPKTVAEIESLFKRA